MWYYNFISLINQCGMKIYLIRHGESIAKKRGVGQSSETPLSKYGREQAENVAERLKNSKIDIIYSSTHFRAKQTAEIILRKIKKPTEYWRDLIEVDSLSENFSELNQKSEKIIKHFISHHKNQSVICVFHTTMIEAIIAKMIFGKNLSEQIMDEIKKHFGTTNTGISICEFTEKDGWILHTFNDSSHL